MSCLRPSENYSPQNQNR